MFTAYRRPYIRLVADFPDPPVQIRHASTVVVAHDGDDGVEVLMVRRSHKAVFMGSAHVFPGGAVDEIDSSPLARESIVWSGAPEEFRWRAAALRELFEEAGVLVGADTEIDQQCEGVEFYEAVKASGQRLDADALEGFASSDREAAYPLLGRAARSGSRDPHVYLFKGSYEREALVSTLRTLIG